MMNSAPPRGPRGTSSRTGGGRGGGIQKRRGGAGPVRVDKDGDLVMDAAGDKRRSGKGRLESPKPQVAGRSGSAPRQHAGGPVRGGAIASQKAQQAIIRGLSGKQANVMDSRISNTSTTVQIKGLKDSKAATNPDGGLESLLSFLERKAKVNDTATNRTIKIKKSRIEGDLVIITASPEDIESILKLNTFLFAGVQLEIKNVSPASTGRTADKRSGGPSQAAVETKEKFRSILATRYDPELKLLNLSALGADEGLKAMGVFDGATTTSKVFPALMVVCDGLFKSRKEKQEAIISVTLANNGLINVSDVASLADTFPDLKNLDLSNNAIADLTALDIWKHKFRGLENLLLTANPIEARLNTDKEELMKRYRHLQLLNGVQVRTAAEVLEASMHSKSPIPIGPPDFRDVGQVGENFIRQFFPLYDNDRTALLSSYYDNTSTFSLSINKVAPRDRKVSRPIPAWAPYISHSRNLTHITHLTTRMSRKHTGTQAIREVWNSLPATRHPDLASESSKYLIECHPLPGLPDPSGNIQGGVDGLILTIHGEFEEPNPNPQKSDEPAFRSFSRTIILGPGMPGSQPIRVISDMVALRAWAPLPTPQAAVPQQVQQQNPEQQNQEMLARQLVEKTGMTPDYAVLCLTETGWDLEKAFVAFTVNKDNLPAEAFVAR